jgi:hypothetical protein
MVHTREVAKRLMARKGVKNLSQTFVLRKVNREKRERKEARRNGERTDQN